VQDHGLLIDADHRFLLRERLLIPGQHVRPRTTFFYATASDHDPGAECGSSPDPPAAPAFAITGDGLRDSEKSAVVSLYELLESSNNPILASVDKIQVVASCELS
jgi:hypothetical protein